MKTKELLEKLKEKVKEIKSSEDFMEYLKVVSQFHRYSPNNQLLILSQMPTATRVAAFLTWKKLGRYVKKGSKAIRILAPRQATITEEDPKTGEEVERTIIYFVPVSIFDISQTEGKALNTVAKTEIIDDQPHTLKACLRYAHRVGISAKVVEDLGAALGASWGGKIDIKATDNITGMAKVTFHELAHEKLHDQELRRTLTKAVKEMEAEAVAFVVGEHFGFSGNIENSAEYLSFYLQQEDIIKSLSRISRASKEIIEGLKEEVKNAPVKSSQAVQQPTAAPSPSTTEGVA